MALHAHTLELPVQLPSFPSFQHGAAICGTQTVNVVSIGIQLKRFQHLQPMKYSFLARGCRAWCQRVAWKDGLGMNLLVRFGLGLTIPTSIPVDLTGRAVHNEAPVKFSHCSAVNSRMIWAEHKYYMMAAAPSRSKSKHPGGITHFYRPRRTVVTSVHHAGLRFRRQSAQQQCCCGS